MSHLSVELKEKYQHEHIESSEHDVVREECGNIGFHNTARANGRIERLPRAEYFSDAGTFESVNALHATLEARLGRRVRIELTLGKSYGFGLDPASSLGHAIPLPNLETLYLNAVPLAPTPASPLSYPRLTGLASLGLKKLG